MKYPSTTRLSNLKDPSPWYSWTDWHFSEKLDGTCVQIQLTDLRKVYSDLSGDDGITSIVITSRSGEHRPPACIEKVIYEQLKQDKIPELLEQTGKTEVTIFGEGFGRGIQGQIGVEYGEPKFRAFAVQADGIWWNVSAEQWFVKELGLEFVPEIPIGKGWGNSELRHAITILEFGDLTCVFAPTKLPEGIIARPRQTLLWPNGSRVLFKLKSEEYYKGDPQNVMDLNFRRTKRDNKS